MIERKKNSKNPKNMLTIVLSCWDSFFFASLMSNTVKRLRIVRFNFIRFIPIKIKLIRDRRKWSKWNLPKSILRDEIIYLWNEKANIHVRENITRVSSSFPVWFSRFESSQCAVYIVAILRRLSASLSVLKPFFRSCHHSGSHGLFEHRETRYGNDGRLQKPFNTSRLNTLHNNCVF